jgi:signal transduction histidine kinase
MPETAEMDDQAAISRSDQMLLNSGWVRRTRLPFVVAAAGIFFSIIFAYVLYNDILAYFAFLNAVQAFLPWIALIVGTGFSVLLAILIRATQVTRRQAAYLKHVNEDLKRVIHNSSTIMESKQKLEHALLQGQKLQAMGTLAGGIAHDFNNLLYAIIGYIEMAREDVGPGSQLHQNLGKVLEACQRGQELVARILTFSRRQHHQLDVLNLKPTIETVLSLLKQMIPASVMLQFIMESDIAIYGNKTLLHQILVNIINNAVDAMDGEGVITILVTHVAANDPLLQQFPEATAQNYCRIEISDTGHGMDAATMERIFEPFYTTKEVGKGTGLGLSMVHSIVKEHKGEVVVTSELGKGTKFIILLPEHRQQ